MKDSGRLQGRQQRFRRHMAGEQRSELQSQTIITHSVDAVSESQRRDCQSHHNSLNAASCSLPYIERRTVETAMKRCAARSRMVAERCHQQALLVNVVCHWCCSSQAALSQRCQVHILKRVFSSSWHAWETVKNLKAPRVAAKLANGKATQPGQ